MTSTIGVTLISAIGRRRACRPRPARPPPWSDTAHQAAARSSWRDRIIENSSAKLS